MEAIYHNYVILQDVTPINFLLNSGVNCLHVLIGHLLGESCPLFQGVCQIQATSPQLLE